MEIVMPMAVSHLIHVPLAAVRVPEMLCVPQSICLSLSAETGRLTR